MIYDLNIASEVAGHLLDIEAVMLRPDKPFTWASGRQSPIYCDNRLILSNSEVRHYVSEKLIEIVLKQYPQAEVIAGVATAGIPHATLIAHETELPMIYIRSKAKSHGTQNCIEGKLNPGQRVVVIEDLVSTGGSSIQAAEAVREAGGDVLGIVSIFDYEFEQAAKAAKEADLKITSLSGYSALIEQALNKGMIPQDRLRMLSEWRRDPDGSYQDTY